MKKSFIALAALATVATAAQAQSSVTIYGVIDNGITRASNAGSSALSNTGLTNGGLSTPRFGFKGSEDLGGGLKAGFLLEGELLTDTGSQLKPGATPDNKLFSRSSFVSLAKDGIGSMQLGFMNHTDYNMAAKYDAFGGNNIGGWIASNKGTVQLDVNTRIENAVQLQTTSLNGLVFTYQHSFGEVAGDATKSRQMSYGAEYTSGPFSAAYTLTKVNSSSSVTTTRNSLYGMYNFKFVDLRLGYADIETDGTAGKKKGYFIGAKVPVTHNIGLIAQYNSFDNDADKKPSTYALGATYAFSKRTTAYLIGAKSQQDNGSSQKIVSDSKFYGFDSSVADKNSTAYTVGIRHTF